MSTPASLLPPNATLLELALEVTAAARLEALPVPLRALWSVADCPAALLPTLAWGLSVDVWDPLWGATRQRAVCAASIDIHRRRGTVGSVRAALAAAGYPDATITEGSSPWRIGDGTVIGPDAIIGSTGNWADYQVAIERPITTEQGAYITELLAATAPARCKLTVLSYAAAPWCIGDGTVIGPDAIIIGGPD